MSTQRIDTGPYMPAVEDVYVFKLVTGEEIIALMHPSEKLKQNEFDPYIKLEKPLVFKQTNAGFSAQDWCPWSLDRIFLLPVQSALIAQEAQPHMAEMYFRDKFSIEDVKSNSPIIVGSAGQPLVKESPIIVTKKDADVIKVDFRK